MTLPRARRGDLLTTKLDDEVVVYDPESKQAHSLNRLAVAVWNHSDGARTVEELQGVVSNEIGVAVDQAAIVGALRKLEKAHLVLDKVAATGPITRRQMLTRTGKFGAVAMATPLIASAFVPMAAAAASPGTCTTGVPGCGSSPVCGNDCFCFESDAPTAVCFNDYFCSTAVACSSSGDCPANFFCTTNTCCGSSGFCATQCTGLGVPLGPSTQRGKTAAGRTL